MEKGYRSSELKLMPADPMMDGLHWAFFGAAHDDQGVSIPADLHAFGD